MYERKVAGDNFGRKATVIHNGDDGDTLRSVLARHYLRYYPTYVHLRSVIEFFSISAILEYLFRVSMFCVVCCAQTGCTTITVGALCARVFSDEAESRRTRTKSNSKDKYEDQEQQD